MKKIMEGNLVGTGLKIGIVASRFNEFITTRLLSGAEDALKRHGVSEEDITVAWVPGAFEIPLVAKNLLHPENLTPSSRSGPSSAGPLPTSTM